MGFDSSALRMSEPYPNTVCSTPDCSNPVYKRSSQKNKYCSNDCRATNFILKDEVVCPQCNQKFKRTNSRQVHCSRTCSNQGRKGVKYGKGRPSCKVSRVRTLKQALIDLSGEKCSWCAQGPVWNGLPLTLQVDHINGDNTDDRLENLRILCPNCHTQTDTWGGRNSGRYSK